MGVEANAAGDGGAAGATSGVAVGFVLVIIADRRVRTVQEQDGQTVRLV
jgi:hypothetical protein